MKIKYFGLVAGLSLGVVGMMTAMQTPALAAQQFCPSVNAATSSDLGDGAGLRDNLTGTVGASDFIATIPIFALDDFCELGSTGEGTFNYVFQVTSNNSTVVASTSSSGLAGNPPAGVTAMRLFRDTSSIVGTAANAHSGIDDVTFSSNLVQVAGTVSEVTPGSPGSQGSGLFITSFNLAASPLNPPVNYILEIVTTGEYNGNLTLTAIPLPPALALFATALLGFGGLKRKTLAYKARALFNRSGRATA